MLSKSSSDFCLGEFCFDFLFLQLIRYSFSHLLVFNPLGHQNKCYYSVQYNNRS